MGDAGDELTGGAQRDPVRVPRWLTVTAGVLAAAAIGYAAVSAGGGSAPPAESEPPTASRPPTASPTADATSSPAPSTPAAEPGPLVLIGVTCVTTGAQSFTVLFGLQNAGPGPVTVRSVSAQLPTGGLSPLRGSAPARRTCGGAEVDPATPLALDVGDRLPVSLTFAAPADCPTPYAVHADVELLDSDEAPATQRFAVLDDLDGYQDDFAACSTGN